MSAAIRLLPACLLALFLLACRPPTPEAGPGAARPADAILVPARHLRDNDLTGFAREALPPALHADVAGAWPAGARWPLDELPLDQQLPAVLAALAAPDAGTHLRAAFDRHFAGAQGELQRAVETLGVFGLQYVDNDPALDPHQRDRHAQQIRALAAWATTAPLADRTRAGQAIDLLVDATGRSGLDSDEALAAAGMADALTRLAPVLAAAKQALAGYGLDLDASLDSLTATLERQTGDTALVRVRQTLAGAAIDTLVAVERHDGRWYRSDHLHNARRAVSNARTPAPPAPEAP